MKVKELKEILSGVPDDAEVIVSAQYGDNEELANYCFVTREDLTEFDKDDMDIPIYERENWEKRYDEMSVKEYPRNGKITGILLSSY